MAAFCGGVKLKVKHASDGEKQENDETYNAQTMKSHYNKFLIMHTSPQLLLLLPFSATHTSEVAISGDME